MQLRSSEDLPLGVQIHDTNSSGRFPMKMASENVPNWQSLQCFIVSRFRWPAKKSETQHNSFLLEDSECKHEFLTSLI